MTKQIALLLLGLAGCASSNAAVSEDDALRERTFQFSGGDDLAVRAAYDLRCTKPQMQCQVLQRAGMFQVAVTAGVRGCGYQATYVRGAGTSGAWILNGPVVPDLPPPPPPMMAPPPAMAPAVR